MRKHIFKKIFAFILTTLINANIAFASSIRDYFTSRTDATLDIDNITSPIYSTIIYLGYAIAICVILITGIQFLTANAQKKAQLKEKLWQIILGVIVLAGGASMILFVMKFINANS